jgi:hypothetical protein
MIDEFFSNPWCMLALLFVWIGGSILIAILSTGPEDM